MSYYYTNKVDMSFEHPLTAVEDLLKKEGFGILTEIDVQATFKKKLDVDFKKYKILGACNPTFAHKAISIEDKIGVFLPCNVVVSEEDDGKVEVSAVSPKASMAAVENANLGAVANEIEERLARVINSL